MITLTDGAALLAAILDDPDADDRRLVYADWLEENGRIERAEFIRAGVLACGAERVCDATPWKRWPDSFTSLVGAEAAEACAWTWRRGFIDSVTCPLAAWLAHGAAVAKAHPLTRVEIVARSPARRQPPGAVSPFWRWYWQPRESEAEGYREHCLPQPLYEMVGGAKRFGTVAEAEAALSDACILWARKQP